MQVARVLFLILALSFSSCKKESSDNNCKGDLKDGIAANDINKVKATVNSAISQLQNKEHTSSNLLSLATLLSAGCNIKAEVICFGCIDTNPPQSEIRFSFNLRGSTFTKVIDITHSPSNMMVFRNMHD